MIVGGREFTDIYDLVGIRILVADDRDCYSVLGVLHSRWNPVLNRFKDYVAMPKFNMYQSLHTTVIGPQGKPVEMQIRTFAMHRRAEYGVAAHWKYKEDGRAGIDTEKLGDLDDMNWVRQLLDWQSEFEDPGEFLESLRFEINRAETYVFTPRGDVIALPSGATPVDFAYAVHTEVGHHTIGARVNGRLVPLESTLENGDVVEVFTSKAQNAGPSRDWLTFVRSPRARSKIRQWFTKERREEAIEQGKEQIAKLMRKEGLPLKRLMSHESLMLAAAHFKIADVSALYASVGEGNLSAQAVVRRVIEEHGGTEGASEDLAEAVTITGRRGRAKPASGGDAGVIVKGAPDVWVKLAKCCTPVPPDEILGFVTKGGGVSVHRQDCTNASALRNQPEKLLEVEWAPTGQSTFLVNIQVEALDRARLLADITMVLSDAHVNILSANLSTTRNRVAKSRFTFEMAEAKHLDNVLKAVRSVPGVFQLGARRGARRGHDGESRPGRDPVDALEAGPGGQPQPARQPGARPAVPRHPGQPPQGRPGAARARLRHRREMHGTQMRKSGDPYITHPLAVTTILADIGMTEPTLVRGAAARHGRGHAVHPRAGPRGLRRRGRPARRRRDQARQGQVRRLGAGRDHPQDDRRDVARHPGAGHQARRPAAQHADPALRPAGDPGAGRPRDPRHLRPAGPPARA